MKVTDEMVSAATVTAKSAVRLADALLEELEETK
jgi:hypothetical protein